MNEISSTLYAEVRTVAARRLSNDAAARSISPTDLAHEALERALRHHALAGQTRGALLGRVSHIVRQVLVDRARKRASLRAGGAEHVIQLAADPTAVPPANPLDLLALDEALRRLEALDERQGRMIEMRYFGGHTVDEVANELRVSTSTVEKEERKARAWLELALAE